MHDDTEDSVSLWREVSSAVEYIAAMERPGFTVWDALAEAVHDWIAYEAATRQRPAPGCVAADRLRALLADASAMASVEGRLLSDVLSAALFDWKARTEEQFNLGRRFAAAHPTVAER